jgi:hypothetical protein
MRYLALLLFALCAHGAETPNPNQLFVFVGEKVAVEPLPQAEGQVEFGFKATYRNLQNVFGDLPLAVIEFGGTDEFYSPPRFAKHEHALIYVYLADGKYHHVKHVFSPLYRLKDGQWAGPYDWEGYTHKANVNTKIKPVDMEFPASANRVLTDAQVEHMKYYPEIYQPFSKIDGNTLVPIMGNRVGELFELQKTGVLKDHGWFQ